MKPRKARSQSLLLTTRKYCLSFSLILIPSQSSQLTLLPLSGQGIHTHMNAESWPGRLREERTGKSFLLSQCSF